MRPIQVIVLILLVCILSCARTDSGSASPAEQVSVASEENFTGDIAGDEASSDDEEDETPYDPTVGLDEGVAEIGEAYFNGENRGRCLTCHTLGDEGFEDGWALDDAGLRRSPEWLAIFIDNPRTLRPEVVIMPPWRGDSEGATIADVVAFMLTLQTEVEHPPTTDIKPDDEPEPNHDGIAGSEGIHARY